MNFVTIKYFSFSGEETWKIQDWKFRAHSASIRWDFFAGGGEFFHLGACNVHWSLVMSAAVDAGWLFPSIH